MQSRQPFALKVGGSSIRNLQTLRAKFSRNLPPLIKAHRTGGLVRWLEANGYEEQAVIVKGVDIEGLEDRDAAICLAEALEIPDLEDLRSLKASEELYDAGNYGEAAQGFLSLAERGSPLAAYVVSNCYAQGHGVPQDKDAALQWAKKAANGGLYQANLQLAFFHVQGIGLEKDIDEALRLLQDGVDAGLERFEYMKGRILSLPDSEHFNLQEAFVLISKAANQGFGPAEAQLGLMYIKGEGTKKDIDRGLQILSQAAERGGRRAWAAQENLGMLYVNGDVVAKDMARGLKWLELAVEGGSPVAKYYLACIYLEQPDDRRKGMGLLQTAAQAGLPEAKERLKEESNRATAAMTDVLKQVAGNASGRVNSAVVAGIVEIFFGKEKEQ